MSEVLGTSFLMESLQPFLQSLEFGPKRLQLILLRFFQLSHASNSSYCLFGLHIPLLIGDWRNARSNDMNELKTGFSVTSIAGAESFIIGFLEIGLVFTLDGFIQLSNLSLKNRIQHTRDFDSIFLGVQAFGRLHGLFQLIEFILRKFPIGSLGRKPELSRV